MNILSLYLQKAKAIPAPQATPTAPQTIPTVNALGPGATTVLSSSMSYIVFQWTILFEIGHLNATLLNG